MAFSHNSEVSRHSAVPFGGHYPGEIADRRHGASRLDSSFFAKTSRVTATSSGGKNTRIGSIPLPL